MRATNSFSGRAASIPSVWMPQSAKVSAWAAVQSSTDNGNPARAAASPPGGIAWMGTWGGRPRARQTAAWKLRLTVTRPVKPSARTRCNKLRINISAGPNRHSVPVMSMAHRNTVSSLRSSTRGEKAPAHSSRMARAAASAWSERGSTTAAGNVSTSTCVMPGAICSSRAFVLSAQTCCSGASPSITAQGRFRKSGRSRRSAWAGNSRA